MAGASQRWPLGPILAALVLASCSAPAHESIVEKDRHLLPGGCRVQAIALTDVEAEFVRVGEKAFIKLGRTLYVPANLKSLPIYRTVFSPSVEPRARVIASGFLDPHHLCPTLDREPALFITAVRRAR